MHGISPQSPPSSGSPGPTPGRGLTRLRREALPLGVSAVLHGVLIAVAYWAYQAAPSATTLTRPQLLIPDAAVVDLPDMLRLPPSPILSTPRSGGQAIAPPTGAHLDSPLQTPAAPRAADRSLETEGVIAVGGGSAVSAKFGLGSGDGADAEAAPFGLPGGSGGLAPSSPFMGVSDNAYRIAYVCDASGQMVTCQEELRNALGESISHLKPTQSFGVIFFNEGRLSSYRDDLVAASEETKRQALRWVNENYQVNVAANPIPAMQKAFAAKPELVYLLTCGLANDRKDPKLAEKLREEIHRLNASGEVRIHTILVTPARIGDNTPLGGGLQKDVDLLTQIAHDNGGNCRLARIQH